MRYTRKPKTRYQQRMARDTGIVRIVGLVLLAAVTAVLWWVVFFDGAEPPKETDRRAQFAAQEEYYRVVDLYGDAEGAVEAARVVFEREATGHAED